jgi:radical SAM superfamily enzyme YgiQ (UPF0313 family)
MGESILEIFPQVDYCISGEAEIPFVKLIETFDAHLPPEKKRIPGLIFRIGKRTVRNKSKHLSSLHKLPDPDYQHYFEFAQGDAKTRTCNIKYYLPIESSRGCTHRCAFCGSHAYFQTYRNRSPNETADCIKRLSEKHRVSSIFLMDLLIRKDTAIKLFTLLAKHQRAYRVFGNIRAEMKKNDLKIMRDGGICEVQIGIEAFDSMLLRKMNKGVRTIQNLATMKYCEELGIGLTSNLIIGFPTESQADIRRSLSNLEYAFAFAPPLQPLSFMLVESSPVYSSMKRYGISRATEDNQFLRDLPHFVAHRLKTVKKIYQKKRVQNNYKALLQALKEWENRYDEVKATGLFLLQYFDCSDFIRIEDYRRASSFITIDGWARELYLFCDEIRSFEAIKKRFPKVPEKELRKVLRKLFKLKVMFTEDDDWLSLAIHASPENRRFMPFL